MKVLQNLYLLTIRLGIKKGHQNQLVNASRRIETYTKDKTVIVTENVNIVDFNNDIFQYLLEIGKSIVGKTNMLNQVILVWRVSEIKSKYDKTTITLNIQRICSNEYYATDAIEIELADQLNAIIVEKLIFVTSKKE